MGTGNEALVPKSDNNSMAYVTARILSYTLIALSCSLLLLHIYLAKTNETLLFFVYIGNVVFLTGQ